jgi:hypothetical protein
MKITKRELSKMIQEELIREAATPLDAERSRRKVVEKSLYVAQNLLQKCRFKKDHMQLELHQDIAKLRSDVY